MNRKIIVILFLITVFSFTLRFWNLANIPTGFQEDEASLGYNAYTLLKTGMDEYQKKWPLYVDTFGDFRPSLHFYLIIPSVFLFGNTIFAVRAIAALLGTLTPLITFFVVKKIIEKTDTPNDKQNISVRSYANMIALVSAFLLAFSPWHITLSRASNDAVVSLFFLLCGLYFFADFIFTTTRKNLHTVFLSFFFFFLSLNSYHTPRVFLPLLLFVFIWLFRPYWQPRKKIVLLFISTISLISLILVFAFRGGSGRLSQVSIFTTPDEKLIWQEQQREDAGQNPVIKYFLHNPAVNYSLRLISNYSQYFTVDFLAIKGGLPLWYFVPRMGLIYLVELPFLIYGLYFCLKEKRHLFFLSLFFLGPLVSATTLDDVPNVQRSLFMLPAAQILIAVGLYNLYKNYLAKPDPAPRDNFYKLVFSFLFFFNFLYFFHQYFHHSLIHQPWYRHNGFVELTKVLPNYAKKFDKVIISEGLGPVHNYLLYFQQIDPRYFWSFNPKIRQNTWGFANYEFVPVNCPLDQRMNVVFVCRGEWPVPKKYAVLDKIYRPDKTPAFQFIIRTEPPTK